MCLHSTRSPKLMPQLTPRTWLIKCFGNYDSLNLDKIFELVIRIVVICLNKIRKICRRFFPISFFSTEFFNLAPLTVRHFFALGYTFFALCDEIVYLPERARVARAEKNSR